MKQTIAILMLMTAILYGENLTLEQCVGIALKSSPDMITLQNDYLTGKAKVKEVRAIFLPKVNLSFSANRQVSPLSATFGTAAASFLGLSNESDVTSYSLGINASQNIWDFGKSVAMEKQVSLAEDLAMLSLEKKKIELTNSVKKNYYNLLQAKGLEKTISLTVKDMKHLLEAVKARKTQGLATDIDVLNAEVEALKFEVESKKTNEQVELANVSLKNSLGMEENAELLLSEEPLPVPVVDPLGLKSFEEARALAFKQRLEINELSTRRKVAEATAGAAYADFWPSIGGQAGYQYTGNDLYLKNTSWSIGLSVSVPLFSGFSRLAKVEQAELGLKNIGSSKQLLEQGISLQVKNNYFGVKQSYRSFELAKTKLSYLVKNLEAVNAKYEQGMATLTELIEAQTKKSSAELENLQALYAYQTAINELEYSIGGKK